MENGRLSPDRVQGRVWLGLAAVGLLVFGLYVYTVYSVYAAVPARLTFVNDYYNLLTKAFRMGQLNLPAEVPPAFAKLANPYDPQANSQFGMLDLSYYRGKLYLYYGVTPVFVLFWPYATLTGHDLPQRAAVLIFCLIGFLGSVSVLWMLWRRYFATISWGVVAAGVLALGLAAFQPILLTRCAVNEVAISCGYAFTMLALAANGQALLAGPKQRVIWLWLASLAYALAVGARTSLLFGAVILLVPVVQAWRERQKFWAALAGATVPMLLCGVGLMIYNQQRFGNPFDFGWHYALCGAQLLKGHLFSGQNFWFNFQVYFLAPANWRPQFPFVQGITLPPVPSVNTGVGAPYGVLTNVPVVWLALAALLAWRARPALEGARLQQLLLTIFLCFGVTLLTLLFFSGAASRYEVDFLPALMLLAVAGIFSLERAGTGGPRRRWGWRAGWGILLVFSVAFNLLAGVERTSSTHKELGQTFLDHSDNPRDGMVQYEQALRYAPDDFEAHYNLGVALLKLDQAAEAIGHFEQALRNEPTLAEAHYYWGNACDRLGEPAEAMRHYEKALRLNPALVFIHKDWGQALQKLGRLDEAGAQYAQAEQQDPPDAEAYYYWGSLLMQQGKTAEALRQMEQAVRLNPDSAEAHNNLGLLLKKTGQLDAALTHYAQAVRLQPASAEMQYNWGAALLQQGKTAEAILHFEEAVRLQPGFIPAQTSLAKARSGK